MFLLLITILVAILCYKYIYKPLQHFKEIGIPYTPGYPIFGSLWKSVLEIRSVGHIFQDAYIKFSDHRYFGFFLFNTPTICIRDAELVKQICIKDFSCFRDHRMFLPKSADLFWNRVMFSKNGDEWRDLRKVVAPVFSASKIKVMFNCITQGVQRLMMNFPDDKINTVEMGDIIHKFSFDFTIQYTFGIDCDSNKDPDNALYRQGKEAFLITPYKSMKFFGAAFSPILATLLKVTFFSEPIKSFFRYLIAENIEYRHKNKIVRPDLLHLLREAQKGRLKIDAKEEEKAETPGYSIFEEYFDNNPASNSTYPISDDDILAQILGFLLTSCETFALITCNLIYELTLNQEVQDKLIKEVDETNRKCNGNVSYEHLLDMKYMDMVCSEVLRRRSPTLYLDRIATKPYTIEPVLPNEKPLHLKPGTDITIPVYSFLNDPRYFPEPEKFDPERFNDENKGSVLPHALLSFGVGPRACLGWRLALVELKAVIYHFLVKFRFVPVEKTSKKFNMCKMRVSQCSADKYWVGLKPRKLEGS